MFGDKQGLFTKQLQNIEGEGTPHVLSAHVIRFVDLPFSTPLGII